MSPTTLLDALNPSFTTLIIVEENRELVPGFTPSAAIIENVA